MSATGERWNGQGGAPRPGVAACGPMRQPFAEPAIAELYDDFAFDDDVPLYMELARASGGRVLEVGCGTGRLLVPLARAGNHAVGLDASSAMLALARSKLAGADSDGRARVRLMEADMRAFELDEAFDLAIVAVRSFGYLLDRDEQASAVDAIARHLRPGGLLAVDLLHPVPSWLLQAPGILHQDLFHTRSDGTVVTRTETAVNTDLAAQVRVTRSAYEVVAPDGAVTKWVVEWPMRYTYRFEAEHLLERAGFDVESVHGGYRGEPFASDSKTMLLVARRR